MDKAQYRYGDKVYVLDEPILAGKQLEVIGGPYYDEEEHITYLIDLKDKIGTFKMFPQEKLISRLQNKSAIV